MSAYNIMLRKNIDEVELVRCLDSLLEGGVDSIYEAGSGTYYSLMYHDFPEGFLGSAYLHCVDFDAGFNEFALALHVAKSFDTEVIFDALKLPLPQSRECVCVDASGSYYAVDLLELEEGVDIIEESRISINSEVNDFFKI